MIELLQNQPYSFTVYFQDNSDGSPLTTITVGEVDLYIRKAGAPSATGANLTSPDLRFVEVDEANMPGVYEFSLTSLDTNTLGELTITIPSGSTSGGNWDQIVKTFKVVEDIQVVDPLTELLEDIKGPFFDRSTDSLSARKQGIPLTGDIVQGSTATVTISLNDTANLDSTQFSAKVFKNGTEASTSVMSTWQELDSAEHPGTYSIDLDAADTDTLGDLLLRLNPVKPGGQGYVDTELQETLIIGGGENAAVWMYDANTGYLAIGDTGDNGDIYKTTDGGANWSQEPNVAGASGFLSIDGKGDVTDEDWVVAATDANPIQGWVGSSAGFSPIPTITTGLKPFTSSGRGVIRVVPNTATDTFYVLGEALSDGDTAVEKWVSGDGGSSTEVYADGAGNVEDLYTVSETAVYLFGADSSLVPEIRKSTDEGSTFPTVTVNGVSAGDGYLGAPAFTSDGSIGWAVINDTLGARLGQVFKSTDSGATWDRVDDGSLMPEGSDLKVISDIHVVDNNTLIAVGEVANTQTTKIEGALWESIDGGASWYRYELRDIDLSGDGLFVGSGIDNEFWVGTKTNLNVLHHGYGLRKPDMLAPTYRFQVVSDSVDLTPVTDSLDDIKGATFDTGTDSLEQIRDNLSSVDLSPVTTALDDIKGGSFSSGTDSLEQLSGKVDTLTTMTTRVLGLNQENYRITDQTYNSDNKLTGATIKLYGNKTDALNDENETDTYSLVATYNGQGLLVDYQVVKDS